MEDKEKRFHPRAPIELKVVYKKLNTFFADYTNNISKGGTFIRTDAPLDVGTEFIFFLNIPTLDQPLKIKGKVQWIIKKDEAKEDQQPGMGIKFVYNDEQEKKLVEQTVEQLMINSLGNHLYAQLISQGKGEKK